MTTMSSVLRRDVVMRGLAFLLLAATYLYRLDTPILWNDEADTAVFARNVLQTGIPTAFDGRNVSTDGDCFNLSRGRLLQKLHPWLQYYVAAASLFLLGHTTFAARALCALLGAVTVFPLEATLRHRTPAPLLLSLLLLLHPQVVLFQRQCRYFPLLILLATIALYLAAVSRPRKPRRLTWAAVLTSVAMFHTHPLAAICTFVSPIPVLACTDRSRVGPFVVALAAGFASWAAWFFSLEPTANAATAAIPPIMSHPVAWLLHAIESVWVSISDLDYINAVPVLGWGCIASVVLFRNPRGGTVILRDRVSLLIAANLGAQVIATAAMAGYEGELKFSLLRYMPHLILVAPVPLFMLAGAALPRRIAAAAIVMLALCNVFTLSFWWPHLPLRQPRISWWPPVYAEIVTPSPDGIASAIAFVEDHAASDASDSVIRIAPQFLNDVFIFYLGDRYLIQPWNEAGAVSSAVLRQSLPPDTTRRLFAEPSWQVLVLTRISSVPPGWSAIALPGDRDAADGARPELTRHRFPNVFAGAIVILRRDTIGAEAR